MASAAGLLATLALVLPAAPHSGSSGLATDLFLGRVLNPRGPVFAVGGRMLDVKIYLYLIGAVHLQLNILSYTAAHFLSSSSSSSSAPIYSGAPLAAAMLTWFVAEYLYFEEVHLYTYDFFAERVGAKLTWGCLCFYPFFYALPVYAAVGISPRGASGDATGYSNRSYYDVAAVAVFLAGWALTRGANLQKFWFKQQAQGRGGRPGSGDADADGARVVRSADGKKALLCGGLWGLARHVNYLGEILEAGGIAIAATAGAEAGAAGVRWLPWLYPLYYVGLLVTRERDDDALCRDKYGTLWEEYCRRVPWRIVPYLY